MEEKSHSLALESDSDESDMDDESTDSDASVDTEDDNSLGVSHPKAIAGLTAVLGAFVLMDSLTMSDGNKFEIIAPFSENRGISLLLKYNKIHILNNAAQVQYLIACIEHASNSRIPVIIERRTAYEMSSIAFASTRMNIT